MLLLSRNLQSYHTQVGFTLFELMIAMTIVAILTAIALPAYQGYVQKAAMTEMLQIMVPYKTAVEICALEKSDLTHCNSEINGIPATKSTQYVSSIKVTSGTITLIGQNALSGLTTTIQPKINIKHGNLDWARTCTTTPQNQSLELSCQTMFRF